MPSMDLYRAYINGGNGGEVRKAQADMITEAQFTEDIQYCVGYLYDFNHDHHITRLNNMHPASDADKIPIDLKFITKYYGKFDNGDVTKRIQLRPSQKCNVDYYREVLGKIGARFPCGLYCDLPDDNGVYNRWIVFGEGDYDDNQFPTFGVLRCNTVFHYICNQQKITIPGVMRSRSSYVRSGINQLTQIRSPQDFFEMVVPFNSTTMHIYYDIRSIVDLAGLPEDVEPKAWIFSDVDRVTNRGVISVTLSQDRFDEHKDYYENGVWWADYYNQPIQGDLIPTKPVVVDILYSGTKPELKIGGGYKKFSVEEAVDEAEWSFLIDGEVADDLVSVITVSDTEIKVKFTGDLDYIGKTLVLGYGQSSLNVNIVAL